MKRISLMLLFIGMMWPALAQTPQFVLSGYASEAGSKELLIGVNVYIPALGKGTTTNRYGFYSIPLPQGKHTLIYSFIGYKKVERVVELNASRVIDIALEPSLELEGVEIKAERMERISEVVQMSSIDLPVQQVRNLPALLGEKDVFKTLQLMPGVQSGSEGSSGLYVRGGGPDQNLIILDDATVYNANHLFGFFSLFNGDALKSIELIKGGFPARYGGRLSSVVDMNMKDGNKQELHGAGGIGLISSRLVLEGPLKKDTSSFLVSGRRTYIDALTRPFMPKEEKVGYYFYDVTAKVNYDFGPRNKVYASAYLGRDKFSYLDRYASGEDRAGLYWENATATFRWNHLYSNKLFSNTSLIYSNYDLNIYNEERWEDSEFELRYRSGIRDLSIKHDLDYFLNADHQIRAGIQSTLHKFSPSAFVIKDSDANQYEESVNDIYTVESGLYIEDEARLNSWLKMNAGIRLSHFTHGAVTTFRPEPRASLAFRLDKNMSAKASFAMMNQYVHLLSNTGIGLPTDLWVPSTENIGPQQSMQLAAGLARDIPEYDLGLSIEGYYKWSDDILGYREGASFLLIDDPTDADEFSWEENITIGQSWSYGTEVLIQKKQGKLSGWIGYTLSWTWKQFDELNFGKKFFAKHDRRHDVSVVAIYKLSDDITLSGTWVYGTGNAITLPLAEYYAIMHYPGSIEPGTMSWFMYDYRYVSDYGEKNSYRMAPYHRMDIGIQFHKQMRRHKRTWELSLYNAYNRKNPFYYYIDTDWENQGQRILKQVSLFPVIPSISYSFEF
ncbi:MAG TPA: TonB-dependent receptor [Bacteroidales bacterium]|nr:TonB-dependent receptor [Bacteroidales bacterium]HRZ76450.1 TonB-dependent receptor [Bacteroidales bacterium]